MLSDAQFAALITAIAAFGVAVAGAIKWGMGRLVKSNDDGTAALIANTASNAVLGVKVDGLVKSNENVVRSNHEIVDRLSAISGYIEDHTPLPQEPRRERFKSKTPIAGVRRSRDSDDSE